MQKYPRVFRIKSTTKQLIKITSAINDLNNSDFVEKIIQETELSNIDFSSYNNYGKKAIILYKQLIQLVIQVMKKLRQ